MQVLDLVLYLDKMSGRILEKYDFAFLGRTTLCENLGEMNGGEPSPGEEYYAYSQKLGILIYGKDLESIKESLQKSFTESLEKIATRTLQNKMEGGN